MVKYSQWQEAAKAHAGLQLSLASAIQRYSYYQKLLGRTDAQIQNSIPQLDALDPGSLQNLNFSQADTSGEPQMTLDPINPDISQDPTTVSDGEIKTLSTHEVGELDKLATAQRLRKTAPTALKRLGCCPGVTSPIRGQRRSQWAAAPPSTSGRATYTAMFRQALAQRAPGDCRAVRL